MRYSRKRTRYLSIRYILTLAPIRFKSLSMGYVILRSLSPLVRLVLTNPIDPTFRLSNWALRLPQHFQIAQERCYSPCKILRGRFLDRFQVDPRGSEREKEGLATFRTSLQSFPDVPKTTFRQNVCSVDFLSCKQSERMTHHSEIHVWVLAWITSITSICFSRFPS